MNFRRAKLGLDIATALLVVTGVTFWLLDFGIPGAQLSRYQSTLAAESGAPAKRRGLPPGADRDAIVAGNIFSASRAAPVVRYTPSGGSGAVNVDEPVAGEYAAPAVVPLRIYGTMSGPNGAMALIQSDSAGASGRLFREGDRVGAFRIEKIHAASVIVRGPSGRIELMVEPRPERKQ